MEKKSRGVRVVLAVLIAFTGIALTVGMVNGRALSARPSASPAVPAWWQAVTAGDQPLAPLEPDLARALAHAGPDARLQVIVEMRPQADLRLAAAGATTPQEARRRIVATLQATALRSQAGLLGALQTAQEAGQVEQVTSFWIFNGLALRNASPALIRALATRPDVALLRLDHWRRWVDGPNVGWVGPGRFPSGLVAGGSLAAGTSVGQSGESVEWGVARIRAPEVWSALGVTGTGVVVANMDTGVDWLHPALQRRYRGYDPKGFHQHEGNWFDATGAGAQYPVDGHGHGTHTMGTIVGEDGIGVAPGARWIAVRVLNGAGYGYDSWIHAGFQWLLAPAGDPSLAPDVVSNSWGNSLGSLTTFQEDINALRAAGILPIFSVGNDGPDRRTVGSPASLPGAFAVGASDEDDEVANFSSRGPSPWGEVRPYVVAPGVNIRSSTPGGVYQSWNGTSMAAPHVAGTVALMLSANPDLTITETASILTRTAVPLTTTIPNNDSGWGRVDAYEAVALAARAGILSGTVTSGGQPVAGATVEAVRLGGTLGLGGGRTRTDAQGRYRLLLAAGAYDVTASAFGYASQAVHNRTVITGQTTVQDFVLTPLPTGQVAGTVREAGTGNPISATLTVLGTPVTTTASPSDGSYSVALPGGVYTLHVRALGYRVVTTTLVVTAGETTARSFTLSPIPRILLVDSGRWYYRSEIGYYREALDEMAYAYDEWAVKHPPADTPVVTDMLPYDLVIWSAPGDSPGYVGANEAITRYLSAGGNLFVSGQDVGYWDGGGSGSTYASYYETYLYARFVNDDASSRQVVGLTGTLFAGLAMTIEGTGGADNQRWPDVITVTNPDFAAPVLRYVGDGSAGQQVGLCRPYRALYLAFGFEAINDAAIRQEVMRRAVDWFVSPRQAVGLEATAVSATPLVGPPGSVITHWVRVRNTGEVGSGDAASLALEGADWPTTILTPTFSLAPCQAITVPIRVAIPATATWDQANRFTLTVRSAVSPALRLALPLMSKAPAPVLLVDDDRWYPQEKVYQGALEAAGIPYDRWDVREGVFGAGVPPTDTLGWYPVVLWFTGYDWFDPLGSPERKRVVAYLEGGGRFFLSSQDYLWYGYGSSLTQDYLGVLTYTEWITPLQAIGAPGDPVGGGLPPLALDFPFPNWSDALVPAPQATVVYRDQRGRAIGLRRAGEDWRTVFLAFPFEALPEAARPSAMARIVGWLSWLGRSSLEADRTVVLPGGRLTYTLVLRNDGPEPIAQATLSNTLPPSTTLVAGSLVGGAAYDPGSRRITWAGPLAPGQAIAVAYQVTVATGLSPGMVITNLAHLRLEDQKIGFDRLAVVRVAAPDLAGSLLTATSAVVPPGHTVTLTLVLRNEGLEDASATTVRFPAMPGITWVTDTLSASGVGRWTTEPDLLTWQGSVPRAAPVTLTLQVRVPMILDADTLFSVVALLDDGADGQYEQPLWLLVHPYRQWMPLVARNGP